VATGRTHRPATRSRGIPEATVARLPLYLRALTALSERSVPTVSSEELAVAAGVNSAKLRKDFSYLGSYGTRGVGYDVEYLVYQISRELGLTQDWPVVIVGIGNLGAALANYGGFASRGFRVAALIDADPEMAGKPVAGMPVQHTDELEKIITDNGVSIGVIATPAGAAQQVCERLVAAGVTSILNFAPTVLSVPEGVDVRKVDLSIELQILAFHEQRKAGEDAAAALIARDGIAGRDGVEPLTGDRGAADREPAGQETAGQEAPGAAGPYTAGGGVSSEGTDRGRAVAGRKGPDGDVPAVMPA
jgi:redox-sensing transcriptional repressor